jgi:putative spermidine/putrescine transport system ATP-binding protein
VLARSEAPLSPHDEAPDTTRVTARGVSGGAAAAGVRISARNVSKSYGNAVALHDVSLDVEAGEFLTLLGPSGSGKTTLLNIVAGFVNLDRGTLLFGDEDVTVKAVNKRGLGMVFQNYALFPHMSAADNVAYGLAARGASKAERERKAAEMLELVQMSHLAARLPREMSGGQQQRVALARAMAVGPRILLLDEPFAALDKSLRLDMQIEVKRLQRRAGITCIIVTHDQEEALSMADRVAVIHQGRLEQFAPPNDVYDRPETLFVNRFVGASNALDVNMVAEDVAELGGQRWPVRAMGSRAKSPALLCVRPEQLRLTDGDGLAGTIELSLPLGPQIVHDIRLADGQDLKLVEARSHGARLREPGSAVTLTLAEGAVPNAFAPTPPN